MPLPHSCDIIRDGGSYICGLETANGEGYTLFFKSLRLQIDFKNLDPAKLNLPDGMTCAYDKPTLSRASERRVISWQQADMILSNYKTISNNRRFEKMKAIAQTYANHQQGI